VGYLHSSRGGGTAPWIQLVWSVTRFIVRFGCQWETTSSFMVSAFCKHECTDYINIEHV